jgi:hypothetical protein
MSGGRGPEERDKRHMLLVPPLLLPPLPAAGTQPR